MTVEIEYEDEARPIKRATLRSGMSGVSHASTCNPAFDKINWGGVKVAPEDAIEYAEAVIKMAKQVQLYD